MPGWSSSARALCSNPFKATLGVWPSRGSSTSPAMSPKTRRSCVTGAELALRLDDVGAASKQHEVYGLTRVPLGPFRVPFPGNLLFLKRVPGIKRWGPYAELSARQWEAILAELERVGARMTVGITAGWVELDGRVVPFPQKFCDAAAAIRRGVERG